ncbi:protein-disulfide reductase DsbD domain-containing protein [Pseudaminobacter sp. NGMCC 1.201702]|uniref:protein-disulfide reductase DsbD domain-containing protein n=1 Tax=Pseudaminobacter sp. NGMCC 1.201702 TaxID=3391825 RepID=UPI0039EE0561
MIRLATIVSCLASLICVTGPAFAASTDWVETEGGRLRLVTAGAPDEQGRLIGALDIELKPGWKTYWRDPGDAGVPPTIEITASTNIARADFEFPAPQRQDDGYSKWAGYAQPIALPVTFQLASPQEPALIKAEIFLGICQSICIPVSARLTLDPANDPTSAEDAELVSAAVKALPEAARADFGAVLVEKGEDRLMVEAKFTGDPNSADFFIAGIDGYSFATPERLSKDGKTLFSVEILNRPTDVPAGDGIPYTLVTPAGAVSGTLPYM